MPYRTIWANPDIFLTHNDVTVYFTYEDDDIDQGTQNYWFTTDGYSDEEQFDVRDLDVPSKHLLLGHPPCLSADTNPAFATASDEQKKAWRDEWQAWTCPGGKEDQAIITILKEAIDMGLIKAYIE